MEYIQGFLYTTVTRQYRTPTIFCRNSEKYILDVTIVCFYYSSTFKLFNDYPLPDVDVRQDDD
jgi:hypothetical protein